MAQLCESGMPLASAFRIAAGPPKKSRLFIAKEIECGRQIEEILAKRPKWLPKADCIFICAAMNTGRLPQTLLSLAERHERMAKNKARVIARLAYPVGVFHIAALIMPITSMIDFDAGFAWSLNDYLSKAGLLLIPTWIVFAILIFLNKTDSPLLPKLLRCIPFLRGYSKSQALSDFSLALATFIETGVLIRSAWYGAARICKDPSIQKATQSLMPVFERGESPEAYLSRLKCFPEYFTAFYKSGAESGKLDETMHRAAKQFQVEANQKMSIAISVYPSIVFAMVAGVIIYTIFQIFGDYIQMIYDLSA